MHDPNSQVVFDPWEERGTKRKPAAQKPASERGPSKPRAIDPERWLELALIAIIAVVLLATGAFR
jgi:hypothetical protein